MLIRSPEWIWEGKEAAVIGQKGLFLLFENFCNISKFTLKLDIDRFQHVISTMYRPKIRFKRRTSDVPKIGWGQFNH